MLNKQLPRGKNLVTSETQGDQWTYEHTPSESKL